MGIEGSIQTCNSLLANETSEISRWDLPSIEVGFYSAIEALVGHLIDFYNVQFYHQNIDDYNTAQELIVASRHSPYTSICKINRFGHVPLDKIVVGKCTCKNCARLAGFLLTQGHTIIPLDWDYNDIDHAASKAFSRSFGEFALEDALGGIAVWEFNTRTYNDTVWLGFLMPFSEQRDRSAFYSHGNYTTSDVPRNVLYVRKMIPESLEGWSNVFSQASSVGVNYIVLAFYENRERLRNAPLSWRNLPTEQKLELKQKYMQTRLLIAFNTELMLKRKEINFYENIVTNLVIEFVEHAKENLFDGVEIYPGNVWDEDRAKAISVFSYMTFLIKKLWPEAIVSHAPQAAYFKPLNRIVEEANRNAILAMFEEGHYVDCYSNYLRNNHRTNIPIPDPSTYQRPKHKENILPLNYYEVVSQGNC